MNGVKLPLTTLKTDFDDAVDRKSVDDAPIFMATKHTNACKNKLQNSGRPTVVEKSIYR